MKLNFLVADGEPVCSGCIFCDEPMVDEGVNGMHEECFVEYNVMVVDEMSAAIQAEPGD